MNQDPLKIQQRQIKEEERQHRKYLFVVLAVGLFYFLLILVVGEKSEKSIYLRSLDIPNQIWLSGVVLSLGLCLFLMRLTFFFLFSVVKAINERGLRVSTFKLQFICAVFTIAAMLLFFGAMSWSQYIDTSEPIISRLMSAYSSTTRDFAGLALFIGNLFLASFLIGVTAGFNSDLLD